MAHVLVADDDMWIVRMVQAVLQKRGHSVDVACDGEDALEKASVRQPDLVITDVNMPRLDGWGLIRRLRARAECSQVPVIFLTAMAAEDDRVRGFRLGADDYLAKPFRLDELDLRVTNVIRRAQASQQETRTGLGNPSLKGDLAEVGLSSLLILIEMERKTGLLVLRAPEQGPVGQVLVREGRIVHARIEGLTEPVDAECVYYLLRWGSGEFEFTACLVEGADRIGVGTTHLLMEGARLMDEADAGFAIDSLGDVPTRNPARPRKPTGNDPDLF